MDLDISHRPSSLILNKGILDLVLIQASCQQGIVGNRAAFSDAQAAIVPTVDQVSRCKSLLQAATPQSLTVMSFHPGLALNEAEFQRLGVDRTIIGLVGVDDHLENTTLIATSGSVIKQSKISLSSDDEDLRVTRGRTLNIFQSTNDSNASAVSWAVLNCHDYTHVDLIRVIQQNKLEVLIVVTYNAATRMYWQYAISDVHRLFCYVVIANVAELGGSGVFAPFRRIGRERNAEIGSGGQVFGSKGSAEFQVNVPLDIGELRAIRKEFAEHGFKAPYIATSRLTNYTAMMPSEHYMATHDRVAGAPPLDGVVDVLTQWNFSRPRVAISQLNHIGFNEYIETKYRIRQHCKCKAFEDRISFELANLERRCNQLGKTNVDTLLDLLVFPEVFIPRSFLPRLQDFSDRLSAIIVAGLDYPDGDEKANANECAVIRPLQAPVLYRKITRSQYDAHRDTHGDRMPMNRGRQLFRFVNESGRGFGVLICYDYSHFDLLWSLNLKGRGSPLDATIIVAHNPFGELYRSCCIADSHRFYQYILMSNVSDYGGSGVFGPIRTPGARQVLLEAGKGIETIGLTELDLDSLQKSRERNDQVLQHGLFMRRPGVFQTRVESN